MAYMIQHHDFTISLARERQEDLARSATAVRFARLARRRRRARAALETPGRDPSATR